MTESQLMANIASVHRQQTFVELQQRPEEAFLHYAIALRP